MILVKNTLVYEYYKQKSVRIVQNYKNIVDFINLKITSTKFKFQFLTLFVCHCNT